MPLFKDYHRNFFSQLTSDDLKRFENLSSAEEKIVFLYKFETVRTFPITASKCDRNITTVRILKENGNKAFARKDYKLALSLYSQCLLKYPEDEVKIELSVIYANRSAALYHDHQYQLAINDADNAFQIGYPKELAYKLYHRKGKCLLALRERKASRKVLKIALECLAESKLSTCDREKWRQDLQNLIDATMKNKIEVNEQAAAGDGEKSKFEDQSYKKFENLNSSVTIKYSQKLGRYIEAIRDIPTGELILWEEPYCAVLLQEYRYTHCFHCFKRTASYYETCPSCDVVIFCSSKCKRIALSTHHAVECKILETIWNSGISITCHMALRIIAERNSEYFLKQKQRGDGIRHDEKFITNKNIRKRNKKGSHDYSAIYNLVTHEDQRKTEDVIHRMHLAIFLMLCLRFSNYFHQNEHGETLSDEEIYMTKLIFHNLQLLQFNAHEVSELQIENCNIVESSRSVFLGGGIYPTLALFNHSCNPDIVRYFDGHTVITRTIRPIKLGEMICENYGPIFTRSPKQERQSTLFKQYWFSCECKACVENWPLVEELCDLNEIPFKCSNRKCENIIKVSNDGLQFIYKCSNCKTDTNILKGLKTLQETDTKFSEAKEYLRTQNIETATKKFLDVLQMLDGILSPPFKDYHVCQQMIRLCFLFRGNKYYL